MSYPGLRLSPLPSLSRTSQKQNSTPSHTSPSIAGTLPVVKRSEQEPRTTIGLNFLQCGARLETTSDHFPNNLQHRLSKTSTESMPLGQISSCGQRGFAKPMNMQGTLTEETPRGLNGVRRFTRLRRAASLSRQCHLGEIIQLCKSYCPNHH